MKLLKEPLRKQQSTVVALMVLAMGLGVILAPCVNAEELSTEEQNCVKDTGLSNVCREAFAGDGEAMAYLATDYGQKKKLDKQYYWALRGAEAGSDSARTLLGAMLLTGKGVRKNEGEAVRLLKLAANESGLSEARMLLARYYFTKDEPSKAELDSAVKLLEACMERGDAGEAALYLGAQYFTGKKLNQDYAKAAQLFARAVRDGENEGFTPLAISLLMGGAPQKSIEENAHRALVLLNLAGEQGDATAYEVAASIYVKGLGVPMSLEIAQEYHKLARGTKNTLQNTSASELDNNPLLQENVANKGTPEANQANPAFWANQEGEIMGVPTPQAQELANTSENKDSENVGSRAEQISRADNVGEADLNTVSLAPRSEENGNEETGSDAELGLRYYAHGNYEKARPYIENLARSGSAEGKLLLARLYRYGRAGLNRKPDVALVNYQQAASMELLEAETELCYIYGYGEFGEPNYMKAASLCENAARQGGAYAALYLSRAYMVGHGRARNETTGFAWLTQAASCLELAKSQHDKVEHEVSAQVKINGRSEATKLRKISGGCKVEQGLELPQIP